MGHIYASRVCPVHSRPSRFWAQDAGKERPASRGKGRRLLDLVKQRGKALMPMPFDRVHSGSLTQTDRQVMCAFFSGGSNKPKHLAHTNRHESPIPGADSRGENGYNLVGAPTGLLACSSSACASGWENLVSEGDGKGDTPPILWPGFAKSGLPLPLVHFAWMLGL